VIAGIEIKKPFNHKGHEGTKRKKTIKGEADHAPSPLRLAQIAVSQGGALWRFWSEATKNK
jgi:hypothetical protein